MNSDKLYKEIGKMPKNTSVFVRVDGDIRSVTSVGVFALPGSHPGQQVVFVDVEPKTPEPVPDWKMSTGQIMVLPPSPMETIASALRGIEGALTEINDALKYPIRVKEEG